jgi:hypothetical protein
MVLVLKKGATKKQMEQLNKKLQSLPALKKLQTKKYLGVIKLKTDPLATQKLLRNEWE